MKASAAKDILTPSRHARETFCNEVDWRRMRDGKSTFQLQGVSWKRQHPFCFLCSSQFLSIFEHDI
ncbi:hypothetical protein XENORESO_020169, partial [Xenotaenia resolanae]